MGKIMEYYGPLKEPKKGYQNLLSNRNNIIWLLLISFGSITYMSEHDYIPDLQTTAQVLNECPRDICLSYLEYRPGEFDIKTKPLIAVEISNLTSTHQFINVLTFPLVSSKIYEDITLQVEVSSFAVDKDQKVLETIMKKEKVEVAFPILEEGQSNYTSQVLKHTNYLQHDHYIFVVRITNGEALQAQGVHNLGLIFITSDATYGHNLIYFKSLLWIIAILSWFLHRHTISKVPQGSISVEQEKVELLSILFLLITQPLTGNLSFVGTLPHKIFVVLLMATQGSLLVSLWFNLLERLAAGSNTVLSIRKITINFFAVIHFLAFSVISAILVKEQGGNPVVSDLSQGAILYKYYSYTFIGIVGCWFLTRLFKILGRLGELDWRDSSSLLFSFYYIMCFIFFMMAKKLLFEVANVSNNLKYHVFTTTVHTVQP